MLSRIIWKGGNSPTVSTFLGSTFEVSHHLGTGHIGYGLPILRYQGIEIDELGDPFGNQLGYTRRNHAAATVPYQVHLPKILINQDIMHVLNVSVHVDVRRGQVNTFAHAG